MKHLAFVSLFCLLIKVSSAQPTIGLQTYAGGFSNPVDIAHCGDERLFIVEQNGYIRIINGQGTVLPQAFLDIDSRVQSGGERGLLGLAFHPDYKNNGYFFVNYTNNSGNTVISRFSADSTNPDLADAASESIVLTINQPYSNHNGGNIEFGPDGYLYIGMGDGGSLGDPDDNGQDPLALLGKMLRLDVDTLPYQIPTDNPFYGFASVRNEIWALGLRNPWRFSFDKLTGDLWIADVAEIDDYVNYLQTLLEKLRSQVHPDVYIQVLGFSQGCSTICRWIARKTPGIKTLWLCSGSIPDDLDFNNFRTATQGYPVHFIIGDEDPFINEKDKEAVLDRIKSNHLPVQIHVFKGGHDLNLPLLKSLL